jgi:hypothetical protein
MARGCGRREGRPHLRLGFARQDEGELREAVTRLAAALEPRLPSRPSTSRARLSRPGAVTSGRGDAGARTACPRIAQRGDVGETGWLGDELRGSLGSPVGDLPGGPTLPRPTATPCA